MERKQIEDKILGVFRDKFEIEDPGMDDDLREEHHFDSIDAIDLLASIEGWLDISLSDDEKKQAMEIRTLNQICDYVEQIVVAHA